MAGFHSMLGGSASEPTSGASVREPNRCSVLSAMTVDTMAWASRLGFLHTVQLFSRSECACIIAAAERADQWALRGEYEGTYTRDVDVSSLPELQWLDRHSDEVWEPLLASPMRASPMKVTRGRVVRCAHDGGAHIGHTVPLADGGRAPSLPKAAEEVRTKLEEDARDQDEARAIGRPKGGAHAEQPW